MVITAFSYVAAGIQDGNRRSAVSGAGHKIQGSVTGELFIVINALLYQVQSHGVVAASDGELAGEVLERVCAAFKHSFKGHLSGNGLAVAVAACDPAVYYSGAQD